MQNNMKHKQVLISLFLVVGCGGGGDDATRADAGRGILDAQAGSPDAPNFDQAACTFPLTMSPAAEGIAAGVVTVCDYDMPAICMVENRGEQPVCGDGTRSFVIFKGLSGEPNNLSVNMAADWAIIDQVCSDSPAGFGACCGPARTFCGSQVLNVIVSMLPEDEEIEVLIAKGTTRWSVVFQINSTPPEVTITSITEQ